MVNPTLSVSQRSQKSKASYFLKIIVNHELKKGTKYYHFGLEDPENFHQH